MGEVGDMLCVCKEKHGQGLQLTFKDKDNLLERLVKLAEFAEKLDLDATLASVRHFKKRLEVHVIDFPKYEEVAIHLIGIRQNVEAQLASRKMGFIPKDKLEYWQNEKL